MARTTHVYTALHLNNFTDRRRRQDPWTRSNWCSWSFCDEEKSKTCRVGTLAQQLARLTCWQTLPVDPFDASFSDKPTRLLYNVDIKWANSSKNKGKGILGHCGDLRTILDMLCCQFDFEANPPERRRSDEKPYPISWSDVSVANELVQRAGSLK